MFIVMFILVESRFWNMIWYHRFLWTQEKKHAFQSPVENLASPMDWYVLLIVAQFSETDLDNLWPIAFEDDWSMARHSCYTLPQTNIAPDNGPKRKFIDSFQKYPFLVSIYLKFQGCNTSPHHHMSLPSGRYRHYVFLGLRLVQVSWRLLHPTQRGCLVFMTYGLGACQNPVTYGTWSSSWLCQ